MKIKNYKTLSIISLCLIAYFSISYLRSPENIKNEVTKELITEKDTKANDEVSGKKVKPLPLLSDEAQYIADVLKPMNKELLKENWQAEFGCFKSDNEEDRSCQNSFLTASSYEESLWMQRQGYPSNSHLKLLEDKENAKYILDLAKNHDYTPALAILAVRALNKNSDYAASVSLSLRAHSEKHQTFPHRIRGEILLADNDIFWGLTSLKSAEILGDYEAEYIFNRYLYEHPRLAVKATNHANGYLGRTLNGPLDQYRNDRRPKENN